jgi:hypothetical protein
MVREPLGLNKLEKRTIARPAASNYRPGEYSKCMEWRRIVGGVLAASLLLTMTLPAVCEKCLRILAAASCGEDHETVAAGHNHLAMSMDASCDSCSGENEISANHLAHQVPASEFLLPGCAQNHCFDSSVRGVEAGRADWFGANRNDAGGTIGSVSSLGATAKLEAVHECISPSKQESARSPYQPLLVSLKV